MRQLEEMSRLQSSPPDIQSSMKRGRPDGEAEKSGRFKESVSSPEMDDDEEMEGEDEEGYYDPEPDTHTDRGTTLDFDSFCEVVRNREADGDHSEEALRARFDELDTNGSGCAGLHTSLTTYTSGSAR